MQIIHIRPNRLVNYLNKRLNKSIAVPQLLARLIAIRELQIRAAVPENPGGVRQHGRVVRVVRRKQPLRALQLTLTQRERRGPIIIGVHIRRARQYINRRIRHDYILDQRIKTLHKNRLLDLLARRQVPQNRCDALLDRFIAGALQEAHQSRNAAAVRNLQLVLVVGLAVREVSEGAAGVARHAHVLAAEEVDEAADAVQGARLRLDRVVLVAQVLQVGARVRLDLVALVAEVLDDLGQRGIAPATGHKS